MSGKVLALHTGKVLAFAATGSGEWWDKEWTTGFSKTRTDGPAWLGYEGFRGDEQADRRYHGGSEKAVCVYPAEHYPYWQGRLEIPEFSHGGFGENLTVDDLPEDQVCIGDRFSLGGAEVQVSQPRQPCWKLARRWRVKDLALQVERTGFTGYYFRVLRHGEVRPGDPLILLERPYPEFTIAHCNRTMHHEKADFAAARALAECPLLSASWKDGLWMRAEKGKAAGTSSRTGQPE
ncbi:MOSC domain-containing protein [Luteolibacter sp. SL250]|uniref:MOSC domain-containing protein n=1 Tax=Luteolibacter sp. SL250 TaxID=2995170 RepID=UPI002272177B|nr:MOSC domain-containing protein [Luteolibacter sp. SL250]WAC20643.1 MOSC domain-containing protein [Luteolibacter sp. SL250]